MMSSYGQEPTYWDGNEVGTDSTECSQALSSGSPPDYCTDQNDLSGFYDPSGFNDISRVAEVQAVGSNSSLASIVRPRKGYIVCNRDANVKVIDPITNKCVLSTYFDDTKKRYYAYDHKRGRSYWL